MILTLIASIALTFSAPAQPAGAEQRAQRVGAPVTSAFLIGRWTDNPDRCTAPVDFFRSGTFLVGDNGRGRWEMQPGQRLVMTGDAATLILRVSRLGPHQIRTVNPDNSVGGSWRCAPGAGPNQRPIGRR